MPLSRSAASTSSTSTSTSKTSDDKVSQVTSSGSALSQNNNSQKCTSSSSLGLKKDSRVTNALTHTLTSGSAISAAAAASSSKNPAPSLSLARANPQETIAEYNTRFILGLCRNYLHYFVPITLFFRDVTDPLDPSGGLPAADSANKPANGKKKISSSASTEADVASSKQTAKKNDPTTSRKKKSTSLSKKKIHWQSMTSLDIGDFEQLSQQYVLPTMYEECLLRIRQFLKGERLWVSITTSGRFDESYNYVNVIVGTYGISPNSAPEPKKEEASQPPEQPTAKPNSQGNKGKCPHQQQNKTPQTQQARQPTPSQNQIKAFLLACRPVTVLDPNGHEDGEEKEFYLDLFYEAMKTLFPDSPDDEWTSHVVQLLTEPLHGMYLAALEIKAAHPRLLHVTCLNRTLHLLEQLIILPSEEPFAQEYRRSPSYYRITFRILLDFHKHLKVIGRPAFYRLSKLNADLPQSFGGPLESLFEWVDYLHRNFFALHEYLLETDTFWGRDQLLALFEKGDNGKGKEEVYRNLATLKAKYSPLAAARALLGGSYSRHQPPLTLCKAVEAVEAFRWKLQQWPSEFEQRLSDKSDELLGPNEGYEALVGWCYQEKTGVEEVDEEDLYLMSNAPIVALNRAQCFPRFEQLLTLFPDYPFPPHLLPLYSIIYCAKETLNRLTPGMDDRKAYYQLDYRQEAYNSGRQMRELNRQVAAAQAQLQAAQQPQLVISPNGSINLAKVPGAGAAVCGVVDAAAMAAASGVLPSYLTID